MIMRKYQLVIGLIVMGASASVEKTFHSRIPDDYAIVTTRVPFKSVSLKGMMDMIDALPAAAALLQGAQPDVIVVPNAFGSYMKGAEIKNIVQNATGVPAYVTSEVYLKLLHKLGAKRIGIISSFGEELSLVERLFFQNHGFDVAEVRNIDCFIDAAVNIVDTFDEALFIEKLRELAPKSLDAVIVNHPNFMMTEEFAAYAGKLIGCPILSSLDSILHTVLTENGVDGSRADSYIESFLH